MMLSSGGGNEGVPQFETVASVKCTKVVTGLPTDFGIDRHANQRIKQVAKSLLFFRPRAVPQFGDRNRRAQNKIA